MVLRNIVDTALGLVLLWLFISTPETIVTVSNSLADLGQVSLPGWSSVLSIT